MSLVYAYLLFIIENYTLKKSGHFVISVKVE